jgi:hypothetical protein
MVNLLETLKARYEDEQKTKESLENKAANLIAFVAIIVTIYTGFFSGILEKQTTLGIILLFWAGTILYLFSGVLSLLALWVRWGSAPLRITREFVDDWRKSSISNVQLEEIFQTDYINAIEDLSKGNGNKARYLYWSFLFTFLGVLCTVFLLASALLFS